MISFEELAKPFKKVLSEEESRKLVEEAANKIGIGKKEFYSKDEVIRICQTIKEEKGGFVGVVATVIIAKIYTDSI